LPENDETHIFGLLLSTGSLVALKCVASCGVGETVMTHLPVRGL
jgi:hypothetical protein